MDNKSKTSNQNCRVGKVTPVEETQNDNNENENPLTDLFKTFGQIYNPSLA